MDGIICGWPRLRRDNWCLDRHEVIYAYGPVAEIVARLKEKGFAEVDMIRMPVPHSHHFHEELDADEGDAGVLGVGAVGAAGDGRFVEARFQSFRGFKVSRFRARHDTQHKKRSTTPP